MTPLRKRSTNARVVKVDAELGIVFGWAIVCKIDGEDYYDLQGDHIPEDVMLEAVAEFSAVSVLKEMHEGDPTGAVVLSMPMTTDVAKAFGIETTISGWMVGVKPEPEMLAKFASGELTGFSIGGTCTMTEAVAA